MVASWAACRHDGAVEAGALPEGAQDNYMAEMAAQLAVARQRGIRRVVIIFDATSPPEALRSFSRKCWRQQQRFYRRDWLDSWLQDLQAFEAVVLMWQTSHVGAPVNEYADQQAGAAAQAALEEELPPLHAARYASLELVEGGGLMAGGARASATKAAQREAVRRL